jgi:hypothetical protein
MDAVRQTDKEGLGTTPSMKVVGRRELESDDESNPPPTTPSKRKSAMPTTPASPSSASKRVKKETKPDTPSRAGTKASKWAGWEELMMLEAILAGGEKTVAWNDVTKAINEKRGADEPRTRNSVTLHWSRALKKKVMNACGDA